MRSPGEQTRPIHVISVQGEQGSGKTFLATSAPPKVAIFSTDARYEGVIKRFPDYKERFLVGDYMPQVDLSADQLFKDGMGRDGDPMAKEASKVAADKQSAVIERQAWKPFREDYFNALRDDSIRTLIWDQADELNEILRLVNFGKLEANPQMNYGPVNQEYKNLIKQARAARKVLVLVHQMTNEYKTGDDGKSASTGRRKRRWNEHAGYLIDSFVQTRKDEQGRFTVNIIQAKLNPMMDSIIMESPSWVDLMAALAPDEPAEAWA